MFYCKPLVSMESVYSKGLLWRPQPRKWVPVVPYIRLVPHRIFAEFSGDISKVFFTTWPSRRQCSGATQPEEHVICQYPLSEYVLSQLVTVPFTSIADFLIVLKYICSLSCVICYRDLRLKFLFFSCDVVICVLVSYYLFVVNSSVMIYCYVV